MKTRAKFTWAFESIVLWSLVGYPFLVGVTVALGIQSTDISIALRASVAALSLLLLLFSRHCRPPSLAFTAFLLFWITYFTKLFVELRLDHEDVSIPAAIYWTWSVGTCFLPALAGFVAFDRLRLPKVQVIAATMVLVATSLLLLFGSRLASFDGKLINLNRWNVESLNPISMGHLGVTAALLGTAILVSGRASIRVTAVSASLIFPGLSLALLSNSRGPLAALAAAVAVFVLARANRKSTLALGFTLVAISIYIASQRSSILFGHGGVFDRFLAIEGGQDLSYNSRLTAFNSAFDQFLHSPIFGGPIEEPITRYYPHNVVLESLMATGITGGIPFIILLVMSLTATWKLLRVDAPNTWLGLLTVQYIVGAQFSGALYNSPALWMCLVLSISAASRAGVQMKVRLLRRGPPSTEWVGDSCGKAIELRPRLSSR